MKKIIRLTYSMTAKTIPLYLLCVTLIPFLWATKATAADYYYGYPCQNMCDCCQVMMQNFEQFGSVTNETDGDVVLGKYSTEYPIQNSKAIFQEMTSYVDGFALARAWLNGRTELSAKELCDWGTRGYICDAGCDGDPYNLAICKSTWTQKNTSVEQAIIKETKCKCEDGYTQNARLIYRCSAGYYGNPLTGSCYKCPSLGTTVPHEETYTIPTSIAKCYIPSGTSFSDATGGGIYGLDCYYNE